MLLKIFRRTGPGVMILIFLTACLVWLNAFLNPRLPVTFHYDLDPMPLYALLRNLALKSALGGTFFSFILILLVTFLLVNFNTSVFFINERTFLPSLIFVLLTGFFPEFQVFNPVLPAMVLLLFSIRRIMESYRKNGTAYNFFDASLLIGAGTLIYANLLWFGLLSFIGIALLRTITLKEILLALLGLCTPLALTVGFYYVTGNDLMTLFTTAGFNLFGRAADYQFTKVTITALIIVAIISVVSLFYLFSVMNGMKIKSRKTFSLLTWTFVIALAVYFIVPSVSAEIIYIAAMPLCYVVTHYLIFIKRKIFPEILLSVIFIMIALIQVLTALKIN